MKEIQVGLIGFGTVGTGVVKILLEKADHLEALIGAPLRLKKVADVDLERDRGVSLPGGLLTSKAEEILNDPDIGIIIELIGGIEPARSYIEEALEKGKCVVTANKALLAHRGEEIFRKALEKNLDVGFEASVGGGIPVILALKQGLVANEIETLYGIVNGTSNFILSQMTETGLPYQEALSEAQKRGYAEADPTLDVGGFDTAHKLAILMRLAYGLPLGIEPLFVEGITQITPLDIAYAREFGFRIKLLAICRKEGNSLEARVHPTMIPAGHMLAGVQGAYNALFIHGDSVGDILLYGQGAGMMPTGSAVVSDLVEMARNLTKGITQRITPAMTGRSFKGKGLTLKPFSELKTHYYFRFSALDRPGVLSSIAGILGQHQISIASVIQKGREAEGPVPIVMMIHEARESDVQEAIREIDRLAVISDPTRIIRVEVPE
jgi:homoserine dehydrogenase